MEGNNGDPGWFPHEDVADMVLGVIRRECNMLGFYSQPLLHLCIQSIA